MITLLNRYLLDTNVWVFGLRRNSAFPTCAELLDLIGSFVVVVPRQLLKELGLNLTEDELRSFYQLINQHPEFIEVSWNLAPTERVRYFEMQGCRKGDAVIAAHAEVLGVKVIVSENRQFLRTLKEFSIDIVNSEAALKRIVRS